MKRLLLALGLLLLAPQAFAACPSSPICQVAGEDVDVQLIGTATSNTSSSFYRSGYARLALQATSGGSIVDPPSNRISLPRFTNQSTVWLHAETNTSGGTTTSAGDNIITLYGSDNIQHLMVSGTSSPGQVKIRKETTAGVYTDLVTCTSGVFPAAALHKLDWFTHYAVSGETTLYIDGVQACDFIGDVTTNSLTAVNQFELAYAGISVTEYWSEIIVADSDTRNMNLVTLSPAANGTTMAWSGTVSNVNGTSYNDTAALTTGTSNLIAEFTTGILPSGSFTIPAVVQSARVEIGTSGPQNFSYIVRPGNGSTDYSTNTTAPTTAFANYQAILLTNPATSAGWTNDAISGIQYGIESQP